MPLWIYTAVIIGTDVNINIGTNIDTNLALACFSGGGSKLSPIEFRKKLAA